MHKLIFQIDKVTFERMYSMTLNENSPQSQVLQSKNWVLNNPQA